MRLLNIYTYEFREFLDEATRPPYVITSHRWIGEETTYYHFLKRKTKPDARFAKGCEKIERFCNYVRQWNRVPFSNNDAPSLEQPSLAPLPRSTENGPEACDVVVDCMSCEAAKATCNQDKPACERCCQRGIVCIYRSSSPLDEQTHHDVSTARPPPAGSNQLQWIWIDTCCINKESSTELTEAINSMFRWYSQAAVCLTYMYDVGPLTGSPTAVLNDFQQSEWFLRGWTLQELLAPQLVVFLNREWEVFGHKAPATSSESCVARPLFSTLDIRLPLNHWISTATGIPGDYLEDYNRCSSLDISEKRKWMRNRKTTRVEDGAYCLLGICGVYLSLIYGEQEEAWDRLEEAIERKTLRRSRSRTATLPPNSDTPSTTAANVRRTGRPISGVYSDGMNHEEEQRTATAYFEQPESSSGPPSSTGATMPIQQRTSRDSSPPSPYANLSLQQDNVASPRRPPELVLVRRRSYAPPPTAGERRYSDEVDDLHSRGRQADRQPRSRNQDHMTQMLSQSEIDHGRAAHPPPPALAGSPAPDPRSIRPEDHWSDRDSSPSRSPDRRATAGSPVRNPQSIEPEDHWRDGDSSISKPKKSRNASPRRKVSSQESPTSEPDNMFANFVRRNDLYETLSRKPQDIFLDFMGLSSDADNESKRRAERQINQYLSRAAPPPTTSTPPPAYSRQEDDSIRADGERRQSYRRPYPSANPADTRIPRR